MSVEKCQMCNGHGLIGGWRVGDGYDAEPCPDCTPALATQPAREAQEPVGWRFRYERPGQPAPWMLTTIIEDTMGLDVEAQPLYATPPDAAATIERLQEKVRNLTVLLDQQFGTPCAQIAYAAELASLREKVKADVAAAYEDAARVAYDTLAAWGDYGWKCQAEGLQEAIRARAALTTEEG